MKRSVIFHGFLFLVLLPWPLFAQEEAEKPVTGSARWFREMLQKPRARFGDALVAVGILVGEKDFALSFEQRLASLQEKEIVPEDWEKVADDFVDKGELSYMVVKALDLSGGLIMRIFGVSQRYAYRELVFQELLAEGKGSHANVGGEELVAVLRRSLDYQRKHKEDD